MPFELVECSWSQNILPAFWSFKVFFIKPGIVAQGLIPGLEVEAIGSEIQSHP